MSEVFPNITGWVGYGDTADILLVEGQPIDADHPVVAARPDLFTMPAAPRRGRPPGSKSRPKDGSDE